MSARMDSFGWAARGYLKGMNLFGKNRLAFPVLMALAILAGAGSYFTRSSNVSDFAKGVVAGIWIGLLLLAVIVQAKAIRR
jgi:hypothetical protein